MKQSKIHLILNRMALCDFQRKDGGRLATTSPREFKALSGHEQCKECARKLTKMEARR